MFHKILVPLDGSTLAEAALEPALALAGRVHGEVLALRVPVAERILVPMAGTYGVLWPDQSLDYSRKEAKQYLVSIHKTWSKSEVVLRTALIDGDAPGVIVDLAASEAVNLICMSTHGYSGLTRWMLGSAAEKVLSAAPCPVLLVRSRQPLRRVLIALDGSTLAEKALEPGLTLAAALSENVTLLRVVDEAVPASHRELEQLDRVERGLGRHRPDGSDLYDEAEAYLRRLIHAHARPGLSVVAEVKIGAAAESILSYAAAHAIDLIVMATHGRSGLRRWVYGSVTEKVLRSTPSAMLVIRPDQHDLK